MKRLTIVLSLMLSFLGLLAGCISFNIGPKEMRKAKDVVYSEPSIPFQSMKSANTDKAWISEKTGNTISYSSECGEDSATIDQVYSELVAGVANSKTLIETKGFFNGRTSISATTEGNVDGINVKMSFIVFKKNNCVYSLSYGGVSNHFESETSAFNAFAETFKAP